MNLLLASNNPGKICELRQKLPKFLNIKTLKEFGIDQEIQETGTTFQENALIKATFGYQQTKLNCLSDDSGLVVPSINGEPGIYSSRYCPSGDFKDNIEKLLLKLGNNPNRAAYFITVLCYLDQGKATYFEGRCYGTITMKPIGENGFGYDSIFIPTDQTLTFAQMCPQQKESLSHRAKALDQFINFINKMS